MTWTIEQIERTFLATWRLTGTCHRGPLACARPTDDVLFTTAGMHPLMPYLLGDLVHPAGRRLTDVQRCVRTTDVDEVGDDTHLTVFEMLGNWSLGDYFKETSIPQSFGLLTGEFGIDPHSLYVTVFAGDDEVPADDEAPGDLGADVRRRRRRPRRDGSIRSARTTTGGRTGRSACAGPDTEIFVHVGDGRRQPRRSATSPSSSRSGTTSS